MSDSRERFEAWIRASAPSVKSWCFTIEHGNYQSIWLQNQWEAWQAAEQETVRRCVEIAGALAMEYRAKYKGTPVDGVRRGGTYDQHDDGMSDGAAVVEDAIRTEFPEAFK